jgi:D-alanine-D-alanine ligase
VKPANGGSSVGVSKVRNREELLDAVQVAAECDAKIIVEEALSGREVECAVLGNHNPEASPVGEVRYRREFYDYEAKYLDPDTEVIAPTDLPPGVELRVRDLALRAFQAIDGKGLSRVDFFLKSDGSLIIEEINTIPGFTPASMYPRLWEAAGVSYSELVTRLVDLALERHREKRIA